MKTETATRLIRRSADEIADIVRERICQCSGDEDQILHEGLLAVEFGVSRTPIRQVLQKLAYEHLVETRSGVGTIVSPLDPDARAGQTAALRALLTAAADCAGDGEIPIEGRLRLETCMTAQTYGGPEDEWYFRTATVLLQAAASLVPDRILADALRACFWRHVRWRMLDRATDRVGTEADLLMTLRQIQAERGAAQLLRKLAAAPL